MASSIGSFRSSLRRRLSGGLLALVAAATAVTGTAAMPSYLREALDSFNAELPAGWAYTRTTVRDQVSTTERYDPAQPAAGRWVLLRFNGQIPTADELEKYRRLRTANPEPAASVNFSRGDIEPGSLQLVGEDTERAEFQGSFREVAAAADKMLGHLQLRLTVNKRRPHVEKFSLRLREPYSPILGVKMNTLEVEMTFTPPAADRPSRPAASNSQFSGRIFFFSTREDLRVTYTDFVPSG